MVPEPRHSCGRHVMPQTLQAANDLFSELTLLMMQEFSLQHTVVRLFWYACVYQAPVTGELVLWSMLDAQCAQSQESGIAV